MGSESACGPAAAGVSLIAAAPKDERSLANKAGKTSRPIFMVWIAIRVIQIYQIVSRAALPRSCRFHPTCSQYTLESIQMYGLLKGCAKAFARILKCSPLSSGGHDPVR